MHWIIEADLFHEPGHEQLIDIARRSLHHTLVRTMAFVDEMKPEPAVDGPAIVMGSVKLARLALDRGWSPGAFYNDNFLTHAWTSAYGGDCLNADARTMRLDEVRAPGQGSAFIRPLDGLKTFTARVMGARDIQKMQKAAAMEHDSTKYGRVRPETMVAVSSPKEILQESRWFVVDGRVVTGSNYKVGGRVTWLVSPSEEAREFAQAMASRWQPARAFVIDVALTPGGHRVIEVNCFNSAGFYGADVSALVSAVEEMDT